MPMKNLLKKLHIAPNHADELPAGGAGAGAGAVDASDSSSSSPLRSAAIAAAEQKPLTTLTGWLNSVASKHFSATPPSSSSSSSSSVAVVPGVERRDGPGSTSPPGAVARRESPGSGVASTAAELGRPEPDEMDEEYQIQLALELSAREDPEAVQIEAVKRISLGTAYDQENGPAGILAYRYWNYNALDYDDKILDGFYDVYNISAESRSMKFPSLVDLQQTPVSDISNWEVVVVNRTEDMSLSKLEQEALLLADEIRAGSSDISGSVLVQNIAYLVANFMGGEVCDPESTSRSYQNLCNYLRASIGSTILPLGRLTIGLARQRALLLKVLADSLEIPCRLTKGKEYTGSDDGALNIIKLNDGREYIVDLMAEPGTLIPSDGAGMTNESEESICVEYPSINSNFTHLADIDGSSSANYHSKYEHFDRRAMSGDSGTSDVEGTVENQDNNGASPISGNNFSEENVIHPADSVTTNDDMRKSLESSGKSNHPHTIARSPSWTEGINSPALHMMKVKDVSEYMINAAKENPRLAQKLHDVLLESGVIAPPSLFTDICNEQPETSIVEDIKPIENKVTRKPIKNELKNNVETDRGHGPCLPHLPVYNGQQKANLPRPQLEPSKPADRLKLPRPIDNQDAVRSSSVSDVSDVQLPETQLQLIRNMPVAAAAATAAVVASSMVVAAAKSNADMNLEVAATATAAAVVATTAAVSRQYEYSDLTYVPVVLGSGDATSSTEKNDNVLVNKQQMSDNDSSLKEKDAFQINQESERGSDKSTETESIKSECALEDVAEFEIQWEDITLGERVGLGSFGEVYHGDWHGTEVAVKRFLHQDISNDALEEFRSEVRIMKRMRHPNVVLFMGAVTRVPNLSIVTEFLPRGSLFRLIHRPNNQLDERRRLRMALDVARGMNYLHNCSPIIVHRDLKSPNLLVDKNWVVKVCDFGLSRMKHNTFLSSRSTAGTAEWMAPEVLKNEPSDEKCDVFSFGVILWELCTLQQPWEGMNPMQVVGAVGFQDRRLEIPSDTDPVIADIINRCWQIHPKMRPSFSEIMAALRNLHKSMLSTQGLRHKNS